MDEYATEQFGIITMDGDSPIPDQENWGTYFDSLEEAIDKARIQHEELDDIGVYTMVVSGAESDKTNWLIYNGSVYTGKEAQVAADMLGAEDQNWNIKLMILAMRRIAELEAQLEGKSSTAGSNTVTLSDNTTITFLS